MRRWVPDLHRADPLCATPAARLLQGAMPSCASASTLVLVLLGAIASSARADVGLLPPDARALGDDEPRAVRAVVDVAREVAKARLRVVAPVELPTDHAACLGAPACRTALLERLEVEELAAVTVTPTSPASEHDDDGAFAVARLVVWTPEGAGFDASVRLITDRDLRGLLTRALDPGRATARLDVTGLVDGDVVLIDGLRSEARALLASGPHTVVVLHADGTRTTLPLTLAFEERRTLAVPPRRPPGDAATSTWPGLWPALIGGGVAIVGGAGAVGSAMISTTADNARVRDTALAASVGSGVTGALGLATIVIAFVTSPASGPATATEVSP